MATPVSHALELSTDEDAVRRRKRRRVAAGAVLALALVGGAYRAARPNGDPAKVQQLRQELFGEAGRALPPDDRKAKMSELRTEMRQLSSDQRSELFTASQREEKVRLERYFASVPAEKVKQLDAMIDRSEKRRAEAAARDAARPPDARGGRGVANGPRPDGPGGVNGGPRSPEQVEQRRKAMLDRTTPDQRALMDQVRALREKMRKDVDQRRQQRGLPPSPPRPGGTR
jgi:hypothetical protein